MGSAKEFLTISQAIEQLQKIRMDFGDVPIGVGHLGEMGELYDITIAKSEKYGWRVLFCDKQSFEKLGRLPLRKM